MVGNIWIDSGDSLQLMPGTTFHFDRHYSFGIHGTLLAEGTETDSIVFTADTSINPERWQGLRFDGSSSSGSRLAYCLIENGLASSGGGVHCRSEASPSFTNCNISHNRAISDGGGIYCYQSSPSFTKCRIVNNSVGSYSGGIYCFFAFPSFYNCIISGNSGVSCGGLSGYYAGGMVVNCTISNNFGIDGGDGLQCTDASFTVINCIITGFGDVAVHFAFDNSGCRFENNCIVRHGGREFNSTNGAPPGLGQRVTTNANGDSCDIYGNIFVAPHFADGAIGDFHLTDHSHCIGAGQTGTLNEDMDGNPRPNPSGSLPDIGAFENALAMPGPFEGLSGALSGTMGPGVYSISDTIYINEGDNLRLLPGTTFRFGGPFSFEIYGTLLAEGTESDLIVFTSEFPLPVPGGSLRFYNSGSSNSRLSHCLFEYGYAIDEDPYDRGGAIYCSNTSPDISHCAFRYNYASHHGGAVYCQFCSPSITDCVFELNRANEGSAVYCLYSPCTFSNCLFTTNVGWGGNSDGAGIFCYESSPTLTDCSFYGNLSEDHGGAVRCDENSFPSFENCIFTDNESYVGGGVSCGNGSSLTLANCTFSGNEATSGGAVSCREDYESVFDQCTFSQNRASGDGGGLYFSRNSSVDLMNCVIVENLAHDGGGVYCDHSSMTLTNCLIAGNSGSEHGGGAFCYNSSPTFQNCTIAGNSSPWRGAGVYSQMSSPTLNSTIMAYSIGSGLHLYSSEIVMTHCDFFGNSADLSGTIPAEFGVLDTTNVNGDSCDTYFNIFLDPMFVDTISGDYHLAVGSPCIDAGDPELPYDPDTTIADIGAFYFDQVSIEEPPAILPLTYALHQNWTNPFNSTTNIRYDVAQISHITLTIYNLLGQQVTRLVDKQHKPGSYIISWNATHLPSGLYFCRMEAGNFVQTRKLVLLK
ncbi:T9SS type A sorting domain-containing protein [bacterium]|nr:T9SS type A sorting domain-containing protein [bacterium]